MEITGYRDKHEYTNKHGVTSVVYLMDCMDLLKQVPEKYFELAVVDPPYNVGASDGTFGNKGIYTQRGKKLKHYANHNKCPDKEFFDELFRTNKNQIIWGSNYYPQYLYHSGAIIWDKRLTGSPMSDCEIAFQSFNKLVKKYECEWNGFLKGSDKSNRIHPNQKPIPLYNWIFKNYAKDNDKILDTHLGSGSSRIAADKANLPFVGCELDPDYFYASVKRFNDYSNQLTIF